MKFTISGKNVEVTESLRTAIIEKLGKLGRFFSRDIEAQVTLSVEKSRHKIEVTIPVKGGIIRGEQESTDMYVSIDLVKEAIESQLKKYRKKIIDRYQGGANFSPEYVEAEDDTEADNEIRIVKVKRFEFKPMDPEEACMQMELLNHNFFVFTNAKTDEVNVVYKRKNNTYGIIEPEF
ncbi:MAG: ribosome hibernation-promoting factor, HPF/YfiA family [Lachnospiraceae bacterium]|jgi:putative sigma-54 modulation protein